MVHSVTKLGGWADASWNLWRHSTIRVQPSVPLVCVLPCNKYNVAGSDANGSRVLVSDFSNYVLHDASTSAVSTMSIWRERSAIDEERAGGISVSASDKLANLLKSSEVTDKQLQKWLSKGKTAESVFYRLDLENTLRTRQLESPQFLRWLQYADDMSSSGKETSAILVLSTKYGDEQLYQMIGLAKKESSTKALGTRLQSEQL